MPNSKATGVAYADPSFESVNVTGATTLDGNVAIGNAASDLIAFHGKTAVDQAAFVATISFVFIEGSVSASALVGFSRGQVSNMVTLLNSMQALLVEKGLMASS